MKCSNQSEFYKHGEHLCLYNGCFALHIPTLESWKTSLCLVVVFCCVCCCFVFSSDTYNTIFNEDVYCHIASEKGVDRK